MSGTDIASLSLAVDHRPVGAASGALDQLTRSSERAESATDSLATAAKGLAAAFALYKAGSTVKELTEIAARFETLGVAMHQVGIQNGYTAAQVDAYTEKLQKNGISMLASRQAIMQAMQAQINLNDAVKLGRIAQDAAVIGNLNSSETYERMITSIQTGRSVILHSIGIMASFDEAYKRHAAALGKTTNQLTPMEEAQARVNVVLEKGALIAGTYEASMGTAGKQAKSMERYIEDLKVNIGEAFQPAYTTLIFSMSEAFKEANNEVKKFKASGEFDGWSRSLGNAMKTGVEYTRATIGLLWEHREMVVMVGKAYAGWKITQAISAVTIATQKSILAKKAWLLETANEARAEAAAAATKVASAQAEVAKQGGMMASLQAHFAVRQAIDAQTAAQARLTAATSAGGIASRVAGGLATALGGPIGVVIALLGAAATAYALWGDKLNEAKKKEEEAIKRGKEYADELERQVNAIKERNRVEEAKKSGGTVAEKASDATLNNLKEQEKTYGSIQVKIADLERAIAKQQVAADLSGNQGHEQLKLVSMQHELAREKRKREETLTTYRRIQQAEIDKQRLEEEGERKEKKKAEANRKAREEEDKAVAKLLQKKQKDVENRGAEYALKFEQDRIELMERRTIAQQKAVKLAEAELEYKRATAQIEKDEKEGGISKAQAEEARIREWLNYGQRVIKINADAKDEAERLWRDFSSSGDLFGEDTFEQKIARLKENFRKMNEALAGAAGPGETPKQLPSSALDRGIELLTLRERASDVDKLSNALRKLDEEKGRALTFDEQLAALDELARKMGTQVPGAVDELRAKLQKLSARKGDGIGGFVTGLEEWSDKASDFFTNAKNKAQDFAEGATDALVEFSREGGSAFSRFADQVLRDLQRLLIQQSITGPLFSWLGEIIGSINWGGSGDAYSTATAGNWWEWWNDEFDTGAASGGFRSGKKPYPVGEEGVELFNPGTPGTIIPNDQLSFGGTTSIQITVQTNVYADGSSDTEVSGQDPSLLSDALVVANQRVIEQELQPGGRIWNFVKGRR